MRLNKSLFILFAFILVLAACNRPPDLPITPSIEFEDVDFEVLNPGDPLFETTVLTLSISIEDGDGDLGLSGNEDNYPYHSFAVIVDGEGRPIEYGENPDDPPFSCLDYAVEAGENTDLNFDGDLLDTILIDFNEDQYNIFVDFFRKVNGVFEEVEIRAQPPGSANSSTLCGQSFDGRFPCLSNDEDPCSYIIDTKRPIKGIVNYNMESALFLPIFRTDTMMIRVKVQDRALHKSNEVETPEFTLQGLQGN
jgi:hypothetical protein